MTSLRIAAMADLHCSADTRGELRSCFAQIAEKADVLLLCGDLTDHGLPHEAQMLAEEISFGAALPVLAVLGNHDFESDRQDEISGILAEARVRVLDGDSVEIGGIGFAGVKGFAGGFGQHTLEPWGEEAIKSFVKAAVDEALKLESALSRLRSARKVAVLHYSPIASTVQGEALEIFPFLGSSRLEEPLNRFSVLAAFHGHAHRGVPEGRTSAGVAVYNVAVPVLKKRFADRLPYRVVEIPAEASAADSKGPVPVI